MYIALLALKLYVLGDAIVHACLYLNERQTNQSPGWLPIFHTKEHLFYCLGEVLYVHEDPG